MAFWSKCVSLMNQLGQNNLIEKRCVLRVKELFRSFQPTITRSGLANFGLTLKYLPPL